MNIRDTAYCFNCKKYFDDNLVDGQGFLSCPKCKSFNVMQLRYDKVFKYSLEIQDELIISFRDKKDLKFLMDKMIKLVNRSKNGNR